MLPIPERAFLAAACVAQPAPHFPAQTKLTAGVAVPCWRSRVPIQQQKKTSEIWRLIVQTIYLPALQET